MAHFAKLSSENIVEQVIVVNNGDTTDIAGVETESLGISYCQKIAGAGTTWKQTSYNAMHTGFRGNFAGIGYTYMEGVRTLGVASTDIFISQRPDPRNPGSGAASWSIGINTAKWYSPLGDPPAPTSAQIADGKYYYWDERAYQADNTVGWALTT